MVCFPDSSGLQFSLAETFYECRAENIAGEFFRFSCPNNQYITVQSAVKGFSDQYSPVTSQCPWAYNTSAGCSAPLPSWCTSENPKCCCNAGIDNSFIQHVNRSSRAIPQSLLIGSTDDDRLCSLSKDANFIVVNYSCSTTGE